MGVNDWVDLAGIRRELAETQRVRARHEAIAAAMRAYDPMRRVEERFIETLKRREALMEWTLSVDGSGNGERATG